MVIMHSSALFYYSISIFFKYVYVCSWIINVSIVSIWFPYMKYAMTRKIVKRYIVQALIRVPKGTCNHEFVFMV